MLYPLATQVKDKVNTVQRMFLLSDGLGGSEDVKTEIQKHHLANRPAKGLNMHPQAP